MTCPECGGTASRVIYAGLPMWACDDMPEYYSADACALLWGFWSWVPTIAFNGVFMVYEGSYFRALWHWLTVDWENA